MTRKKLKGKRKTETIRYLIFGILTACVNFCIYFVWRKIFRGIMLETGSEGYYLISNTGQVIAFVISTIFAFWVNGKYVFEAFSWKTENRWRKFKRFFIGRVSSAVIFEIILFNLLMVFAVRIQHIDVYAKVTTSTASTIYNYVLSKFKIFNRNERR